MKICFITSTRADFGLLNNVIKKVRNKKKFKVKLIASGTHFSKKFGSTFKEINKSKIKINNKIILKYDTKRTSKHNKRNGKMSK